MDDEKHHRRSIRMHGYDYCDGGMYFVTIGTKNRERIFGDIRHGMVGLSDIGCIVADELQKTPIIRPYVALDEWIIMPNHLHVILYMDDITARRGMARHAPTTMERHFAKPIPGSLSTIIGSFKSATTRSINLFRDSPGEQVWQRNFYEHIIRNEDECMRIRRYITDNPINWDCDPENI